MKNFIRSGLKLCGVVFIFLNVLNVSHEKMAFAEEIHAGNNLGLFITGLSGDHRFKFYIDQVVHAFHDLLSENGYTPDQLIRFGDALDPEKTWGNDVISKKTNLDAFMERVENVEPYDQVFIFISGHANGRDEDAVFHLPGKDISYGTFVEWVKKIPAKKMIFVLMAPQGEYWIKELSGENHILIVGNGLREFDVIPTMFLRLLPFVLKNAEPLEKEMADKLQSEQGVQVAPKTEEEELAPVNVSIRDLFAKTQELVQGWYRENGLKPTEIGLLDADGNGIGETLLSEELDFYTPEREKLAAEKAKKEAAQEQADGKNVAAEKEAENLKLSAPDRVQDDSEITQNLESASLLPDYLRVPDAMIAHSIDFTLPGGKKNGN